jgi:hypothetical protein
MIAILEPRALNRPRDPTYIVPAPRRGRRRPATSTRAAGRRDGSFIHAVFSDAPPPSVTAARAEASAAVAARAAAGGGGGGGGLGGGFSDDESDAEGGEVSVVSFISRVILHERDGSTRWRVRVTSFFSEAARHHPIPMHPVNIKHKRFRRTGGVVTRAIQTSDALSRRAERIGMVTKEAERPSLHRTTDRSIVLWVCRGKERPTEPPPRARPRTRSVCADHVLTDQKQRARRSLARGVGP